MSEGSREGRHEFEEIHVPLIARLHTETEPRSHYVKCDEKETFIKVTTRYNQCNERTSCAGVIGVYALAPHPRRDVPDLLELSFPREDAGAGDRYFLKHPRKLPALLQHSVSCTRAFCTFRSPKWRRSMHVKLGSRILHVFMEAKRSLLCVHFVCLTIHGYCLCSCSYSL